MTKESIAIGALSDREIAQILRELGDNEGAAIYDNWAEGLESDSTGRAYTFNEYQYGFIPPFEPGSKKLHKIISATNMPADETLKNQPITIKLERLWAYEYPLSFKETISEMLGHPIGNTEHTILFNFKAQNQTHEGNEQFAFSQQYQIEAKHNVSVSGQPIFVGLNVSPNGVLFSCQVVTVKNSDDEALFKATNSATATTGLTLLRTSQPALVPLTYMAQGIVNWLVESKKGIGIQDFTLGLDFDTGGVGARLAEGSYVVVQVPKPGTINWADWGYDANSNMIINKTELKSWPYNSMVFRVSKPK